MTRKKILLVDDSNTVLLMHRMMLSGGSYELLIARNGLEAVEKAFAMRPDVILMDLSLPVLSGWDATRQLKQDANTRHIPVMALTGHVLPTHSDQAKEVGCDEFVSKPALPDTVADKIRALLQKTGSKPRSR